MLFLLFISFIKKSCYVLHPQQLPHIETQVYKFSID